MNSTAAEMPEPVVLIIADISGYTRYMTANAKTLAHSQTIITELVKAIVGQVKLPIEIAKLEGDAVFLFCRKQSHSPSWPNTKRWMGEKLFEFFCLFSQRVSELRQSTTCTCNACTHIEKLRLKIVAHSGQALFHRVFNFVELAGVDVILVHRLLKNSVKIDQYLLLTEAAREDLDFPEPLPWSKGVETYDEIGSVVTWVCPGEDPTASSPAGGQTGPNAGSQGEPPPFSERFTESWKLCWKLWFSPLVPRSSANHGTFHHIVPNSRPASTLAFGLLTILLTPVFLFVGTVSISMRALRRGSRRAP